MKIKAHFPKSTPSQGLISSAISHYFQWYNHLSHTGELTKDNRMNLISVISLSHHVEPRKLFLVSWSQFVTLFIATNQRATQLAISSRKIREEIVTHLETLNLLSLTHNFAILTPSSIIEYPITPQEAPIHKVEFQ